MMHPKALPSDWRAMCGLSVCMIYSWVADLMASDDPDASQLYHERNDHWIPADEKKMRIRAEIYENVLALELNLGTLSHCFLNFSISFALVLMDHLRIPAWQIPSENELADIFDPDRPMSSLSLSLSIVLPIINHQIHFPFSFCVG